MGIISTNKKWNENWCVEEERGTGRCNAIAFRFPLPHQAAVAFVSSQKDADKLCIRKGERKGEESTPIVGTDMYIHRAPSSMQQGFPHGSLCLDRLLAMLHGDILNYYSLWDSIMG